MKAGSEVFGSAVFLPSGDEVRGGVTTMGPCYEVTHSIWVPLRSFEDHIISHYVRTYVRMYVCMYVYVYVGRVSMTYMYRIDENRGFQVRVSML